MGYAHGQVEPTPMLNLTMFSNAVSTSCRKKLKTLSNASLLTRKTYSNVYSHFSKVRQTRQDELYREWLQMYVVKLDEWKSLQLTQLQEELSTYQKQIIIQSQSLISSINREANLLKAQILREEQEGASQEVNEIIAQIESLSSQQTLQHLGSETMTKMNLTVQANVGRKAPGQHCKFDFGDNVEVPAPPVKRPPSKTNNANRRGDNGKQEEQ